jgi:hypothetical protein
MGKKRSEPTEADSIFADPPTEEELAAAEAKLATLRRKHTDFLFLEGAAALNLYLVERRALVVLSLVQAFHRRQVMKKKRLVAVVPEMWRDAGDPPRHVRLTMLKHLRRMPELIRIHRANSTTIHYLFERGPVWEEFKTAARKRKTHSEVDDGGAYDNLDQD